MHHSDKQHLVSVKLAEARPTQMTVGFVEVSAKRTMWERLALRDKEAYLRNHCLPAVRGPKSMIYIIDHHHLGLALLEDGIEHTHALILRDFSALQKDEFWTIMDHHQWAHAYDEKGRRCDISKLPKRLDQMRDDPYRSLAGEARNAGAFAKDNAPFAEFMWADFFRHRIALKGTLPNDEVIVQRAVELARSTVAAHLPGWCGEQPK